MLCFLLFVTRCVGRCLLFYCLLFVVCCDVNMRATLCCDVLCLLFVVVVAVDVVVIIVVVVCCRCCCFVFSRAVLCRVVLLCVFVGLFLLCVR